MEQILLAYGLPKETVAAITIFYMVKDPYIFFCLPIPKGGIVESIAFARVLALY